MCIRLREDIAKEVGFVETHLSHYTRNQWREFFRMLPSTAESLLREVAPFLAEPENREMLEIFADSDRNSVETNDQLCHACRRT